jgi:hypothetical protein
MPLRPPSMSELAPVDVGTCDRQTTDLYQAANDAVFARGVQLADGSKQHAAQVNQADGGDTLTDASQFLDVSNFKTLLEDAQKPLSNEAAITAASQAAINTQVERLTEYAKQDPDHELVAANQELIKAGAASATWSAGPGNFSVSSFYAWALGGGVPFLGETPLAFLFGGTGKSWGAWATGTAVIGGSFVLDPNTICLSNDFKTEDSPIGVVRKGTCNFTASGGGAGISEVNISFYSNSGTFWGTLSGSGALVGGLSVDGQLDLTWQGWH